MAVPESCTVLVVGGGPGGSYSATALAREGIDVVLLEAEKFPRYHIGESMLPSIRHFLKFIDCYDKFDQHGFIHKNGAAFRLIHDRPHAYTDFLAANGPKGYSWNVIRSEADEILFKHAGSQGVKTFDATKVDGIQFEPGTATDSHPGRPVSVTWTQRSEDGSAKKGSVAFKYLIDASGRSGLLSTRYLKNRKFNEGLKNIANWGYWKGGDRYGQGTYKEGAPFFEALGDKSGWCWYIPLHNGTISVGVVQNQEMATAKKRDLGSPSTKEYYLAASELAPQIKELLAKGELVSDVKSASDWSYSASTYSIPYARMVGDAACFIDPYFSSGCHLAYQGGLSAAVTIASSIRGEIDEQAAASWHSKRITDSYTRFYLVVCAALKQIRCAEQPVVRDFDEEGFDRAFDLFRPIIQGTVDSSAREKGLTQDEINNTVQFCLRSLMDITPEQKENLFAKIKSLGLDAMASSAKDVAEIEKHLSMDEKLILNSLRAKNMLREDAYSIESFSLDAIDGLAPRLEHGNLGLTSSVRAKLDTKKLYDMEYLGGKAAPLRNEAKVSANGHTNGHANGHGNVEKTSKTDPLASLKQALAPFREDGTSLDAETRHAMIAMLQETSESLETSRDMLMRFCESGRQVALIRIAILLELFTTLASAAPNALTSAQLAEAKGADPLLVSRICRWLAASRLVTERDSDTYAANKATHGMAEPGIEGGLSWFHVVHNRAMQALPDALRDAGFQNPSAGVWKKAANTDLEVWPWLKLNEPDVLKGFHHMMTLNRYGHWLSIQPNLLKREKFADSGRTVFVDVGGSVGHQTVRVKEAYPELAGRLVCQDLPEVVAQAAKVEGVEFMAHDFFKPQPVQGAHYYYLRSICHDWDDESAVKILQNIIPAMAPDSKVLIDEMVLPNKGAHIWPAGQDLQMMSMFGSMERTVDQWHALVDRAGFKIVDMKLYAPVMQTTVITAELK